MLSPFTTDTSIILISSRGPRRRPPAALRAWCRHSDTAASSPQPRSRALPPRIPRRDTPPHAPSLSRSPRPRRRPRAAPPPPPGRARPGPRAGAGPRAAPASLGGNPPNPAAGEARRGKAKRRGRKFTRRFSAAAGRGARSRRPFKQKKPLPLPAARLTPQGPDEEAAVLNQLLDELVRPLQLDLVTLQALPEIRAVQVGVAELQRGQPHGSGRSPPTGGEGAGGSGRAAPRDGAEGRGVKRGRGEARGEAVAPSASPQRLPTRRTGPLSGEADGRWRRRAPVAVTRLHAARGVPRAPSASDRFRQRSLLPPFPARTSVRTSPGPAEEALLPARHAHTPGTRPRQCPPLARRRHRPLRSLPSSGGADGPAAASPRPGLARREAKSRGGPAGLREGGRSLASSFIWVLGGSTSGAKRRRGVWNRALGGDRFMLEAGAEESSPP